MINRIKLAKLIMKLSNLATDKGELSYEGPLEVGTEVFTENEGEVVPAPDGEYKTEDKIIVVAEGKVAEIKEVETQAEEDPAPTNDPEPEPEDNVENLKTKIEELNQVIADKDQYIAELEGRIKELEAKVTEAEEKMALSAQVPAKEAIKENPENPALAYFN